MASQPPSHARQAEIIPSYGHLRVFIAVLVCICTRDIGSYQTSLHTRRFGCDSVTSVAYTMRALPLLLLRLYLARLLYIQRLGRGAGSTSRSYVFAAERRVLGGSKVV